MPNTEDKFTTLFDYIKWRGDILLSQVPLNEVDALALTQVAYIMFDNAFTQQEKLSLEYAMCFVNESDYEGDYFAKIRYQFSVELAKCDRYKNLLLHNYTNIIDKEKTIQFAAVCFQIQDDLEFVAYRGTGDDIIGWHEDFNLTFLTPIPAQAYALQYFENVYQNYTGQIILGGHSKGGNLAVYSALHCSEKLFQQIKDIYSFDGPGFSEDFTGVERAEKAKKILKSYIPQNCVVGILLNYFSTYTVVNSNSLGIFQHNALSWNVQGAHFAQTEREDSSYHFENRLQAWLQSISKEKIAEIINVLFTSLGDSGIVYLSDLAKNPFKLVSAISALNSLDSANKKSLNELTKIVISYATECIGEQMK